MMCEGKQESVVALWKIAPHETFPHSIPLAISASDCIEINRSSENHPSFAMLDRLLPPNPILSLLDVDKGALSEGTIAVGSCKKKDADVLRS
jgi:hypothetical protein